MTLRHMKLFIAVYQNQGVTKAAHQLHLAQPSISLAIRELEDYYGVRLFDRIGRRILPTECGKEFYGYAIHILSLFDEMEKKIKNWDTIGTLRVGASMTIGTHLLPEIIKQFQNTFPSLTIEAVIHTSSTIEQHILNNTIDIGLIENTPNHSDILFEPFMKDSLCAIVPPEHPLTKKNVVTLLELAKYPFLMREKGSAGREILDAHFALEQLSIKPLWESTSTQAIIKGVETGLGIAILPYLLVESNINDGSVKQVSLTKPLQRDLNIIYHKSKYLTSNMKSFISLCKHSL